MLKLSLVLAMILIVVHIIDIKITDYRYAKTVAYLTLWKNRQEDLKELEPLEEEASE